MRFYSRPGNELTRRFPLIVETLARLRSRSCIIDGETASPSMIQERERKRPNVSTISGKRWVRSLPGRL